MLTPDDPEHPPSSRSTDRSPEATGPEDSQERIVAALTRVADRLQSTQRTLDAFLASIVPDEIDRPEPGDRGRPGAPAPPGALGPHLRRGKPPRSH